MEKVIREAAQTVFYDYVNDLRRQLKELNYSADLVDAVLAELVTDISIQLYEFVVAAYKKETATVCKALFAPFNSLFNYSIIGSVYTEEFRLCYFLSNLVYFIDAGLAEVRLNDDYAQIYSKIFDEDKELLPNGMLTLKDVRELRDSLDSLEVQVVQRYVDRIVALWKKDKDNKLWKTAIDITGMSKIVYGTPNQEDTNSQDVSDDAAARTSTSSSSLNDEMRPSDASDNDAAQPSGADSGVDSASIRSPLSSSDSFLGLRDVSANGVPVPAYNEDGLTQPPNSNDDYAAVPALPERTESLRDNDSHKYDAFYSQSWIWDDDTTSVRDQPPDLPPAYDQMDYKTEITKSHTYDEFERVEDPSPDFEKLSPELLELQEQWDRFKQLIEENKKSNGEY